MYYVMPVYSVIYFVILMLFSWNVEDKRQLLIVWIVFMGGLLAWRASSPWAACPGILFGMLRLL